MGFFFLHLLYRVSYLCSNIISFVFQKKRFSIWNLHKCYFNRMWSVHFKMSIFSAWALQSSFGWLKGQNNLHLLGLQLTHCLKQSVLAPLPSANFFLTGGVNWKGLCGDQIGNICCLWHHTDIRNQASKAASDSLKQGILFIIWSCVWTYICIHHC